MILKKKVNKACILILKCYVISAAAATDDINLALDYAKVSERVIAHTTAKPVELLETLVEQIAAIILTEFATEQVTIRVSKLQQCHKPKRWESKSPVARHINMAQIFISLGSNVNKEHYIRQALDALKAYFPDFIHSSFLRVRRSVLQAVTFITQY